MGVRAGGMNMKKDQKQKVYRLVTVSYGYIDVPADSTSEALDSATALCASRSNFEWTLPTNPRIIDEL